jgi:hypothetical protein
MTHRLSTLIKFGAIIEMPPSKGGGSADEHGQSRDNQIKTQKITNLLTPAVNQ